MGKIVLRDICLYAYHGCMDEERVIGSDYRVDITVEADLKRGARSDRLSDTVDYGVLNQIARAEMARRSRLLEHVAQRILDRIGRELKTVQRAEVCVSKLAPPISGDVERVSVILEQRYF